MRPPESFISQPIRDMQTMLRVIAKQNGKTISLIPDGIYGANTMQAVSDFQREMGLPPTGTADQATWEAIRQAYFPAKVEQMPAQPLHILLNANEIIRKGDKNANLFLIQAMLEVLSIQFENVEKPSFNGVLDQQTSDSIASFQTLSGLPETGNLDKMTWRHLALQYPLAASLDNLEDARKSEEPL